MTNVRNSISLLYKENNYEEAESYSRELSKKYSQIKEISSGFNLISDVLYRKMSGTKVREGAYPSFCVILNVTEREIERILILLDIWSSLFQKKPSKYQISFKIIFDKISDELKYFLINKLTPFVTKGSFVSVDVISLNIPNELNFYKREVDGSVDVNKNKYGYKSGPNYQFFQIFKLPFINDYEYVLITESDCFPVKDNWLDIIFDEVVEKKDFWVLGSPFRGASKIGPDIALHINGVAVYAVGVNGFLEMMRRWECELTNLTSEYPNLAYDWSWEAYYNKVVSNENWGKLTSSDIQEYIKYRKMFVFSSAIVNLAGEAERAGEFVYAFDDLNYHFPGIALVHGDYFAQAALDFSREK